MISFRPNDVIFVAQIAFFLRAMFGQIIHSNNINQTSQSCKIRFTKKVNKSCSHNGNQLKLGYQIKLLNGSKQVLK